MIQKSKSALLAALLVIWADDNSNYAGVYMAGPENGRVCIVDHDDLTFDPAYGSVKSFLVAQLNGMERNIHWRELPRDFPNSQDKSLAGYVFRLGGLMLELDSILQS